MFSRKGHRRNLSWNPDTRARFDTPLDELVFSLDRVEQLVKKARSSWEEESLKPVTPSRDLSGLPGASFLSRRTAAKKEDDNKFSTPEKVKPFSFGRPERDAKFIPMRPSEVEELIELLRRIAELVILGEKTVARAEVRADRQREQPRRQNSDGVLPRPEKQDEDTSSHLAIFETFFERNSLSLIVNIATGVAFSTPLEPSFNEGDGEKEEEEEEKGDADTSRDRLSVPAPDDDCTLLPPLSVATQAIQSVSILIQNVARATSLYFLLSNNHINELIDLPLELYTTAERNSRGADAPTPRRGGSPEIAELTTHFVSFLKSLAMRMNVETLQFFLTYPEESADAGQDSQAASSSHFCSPVQSPAHDDDDHEQGPMDEARSYTKKPEVNQPVAVKAVKVEFPLYRRALEFCAAHQDSFVRVTAMNVCLNTLRLATISPAASNENAQEARKEGTFGSSPDGVLHNAKPLPLRERLAIAQHVCDPTRVAGLVSPMFTKLAELWGVLEECFREMDTKEGGRGSGSALDDTTRRRTAKVEKAREETRRRRIGDNFHDAAASIQDELLMLEDVFKVGLTSLNEQTIEMMMATFVYPLLLQPLLMYMQTMPSANDPSSRPAELHDGSDSFSGELKTDGGLRKETGRSHESAPAKTAFFNLASVFHLLTNRPLLRLMLTALFHPLSPDPSAETVIQARPDVACAGPGGEVNVRVDEQVPDPSRLIGDERRYSYSFGEVTGQRSRINDSVHSSGDDDVCVFVLSPALAYVLEGRGGNLNTIVKTRPNPYRRSILQCVVGSDVSSHMKELSILTMDAAVSKFDGRFLGDMIFGSGMKRYGDEMPMDERRLDSSSAYVDTNRGMGGGGNLESRRAFKREPASQAGKVETNPTVDVVAPLCLAVLKPSSGADGTWVLEYDDIAAHALLCTSRSNVRAMEAATKLLDRRKRQAAKFLTEVASRVDVSDVQSAFLKAPSIEEEDEMRTGMAMDHMFYDPVRTNGRSTVEELLPRFKDRGKLSVKDDYSVPVSLESSFADLSQRACYLTNESLTTEAESSIGSASYSAFVLFQIDALARLMQELAATNGSAFRDRKLAGFAISGIGSILDTTKFREENTERSIYAPISKALFSEIFSQHEGTEMPVSGSIVSLVGHPAFPCVCEVPDVSASLFADAESSLVAAGVKWQSLYLVFLGRYLILAEPEKDGPAGNGRVVTSCELAQVRCEKDPIPSTGSSPARRLLISYIGFDAKPPGLFAVEEEPITKFFGPFVHLQVFISFLDVWFEDGHAADQAYNVMSCKIAEAKSKRGNDLRTRYGAGT